jgi:putative membrane protein
MPHMTFDWGGMAGGIGILGLIWFLAIVAFWGLIIAALVLGVRWLIRQDQDHRLPPGPPPMPPAGAGPRPDDPLEILRQRYARGEIDEEEYARRKATLSGG